MLKFKAVRAKSIKERTRLRASINVVSRNGGLAVFFFFFTKMVFAASPKTKYSGRKGRKTQNILVDGCYLLFGEYLQEKPVFIP